MSRVVRAVAAAGLALSLLPCGARRVHGSNGTAFRPQPRIVNGVVTAEHPTTAAVLLINDPSDPTDVSTECSGVLVGCQTVLTAAHCVCPDEVDNAGACIAAGISDPSTITVFLQHVGFVPVASISLNPSYEFAVGSDIAILKLATPVSGVAPSHINTTAPPAAGTTGTIVGFGISVDSAEDSGVKRSGKVMTAACQPPISDSTHVCWTFTTPIGPVGEDSNTCNGDSGGPLFINFGNGDRVAGLTSGGEPGCWPNSRSWDTSLFNDRAWVQTEAGADLDRATCGDVPQVGSAGAQVTATSGVLNTTQRDALSTLEVPAGTQLLRVTLNGADEDTSVRPSRLNDFDLYVKRDSPPNADDYDCRDIGAAPYGACAFNTPEAGTWYVVAHWVEGGGTYQVTATTFGAVPPCAGDCNGDGEVTVDELIKGVNIALGSATLEQCPSFDANGDGEVTVDELVRAVNNALTGCTAG